ncbi:hypothetical protein [Caproicibacter sp.]|uniref:hypothetical protein n=1 Tax=Caproicibacter sp. TaxID=2814884 RepID=UPI003988AA0C
MSEILKFTDGTELPIIAWCNPGDINFQGAYRKQRTARIAESAVESLDTLKTLLSDSAKTVKLIHTLEPGVTVEQVDTTATADSDGTTTATRDDGNGDVMTTVTTVSTDTTAHTRTTTVQQSVELDNFVFPHHVTYKYDVGEYEIGLCQKTDTELQAKAAQEMLAAVLNA